MIPSRIFLYSDSLFYPQQVEKYHLNSENYSLLMNFSLYFFLFLDQIKEIDLSFLHCLFGLCQHFLILFQKHQQQFGYLIKFNYQLYSVIIVLCENSFYLFVDFFHCLNSSCFQLFSCFIHFQFKFEENFIFLNVHFI